MIYCPNKNTKEWKEQVAALGEDAAYLFWHRNNGKPLEDAPNGKPSKLFADILKSVNNDKIEAIKRKAYYYTGLYTGTNDWLSGNGKFIDSNGEPLFNVDEEIKDFKGFHSKEMISKIDRMLSSYKDIAGNELELEPKIETGDDIIDSNLFKELLDHSNDIKKAQRAYLLTKTAEFKAWDPMVDRNGEPVIKMYDGLPVFFNTKGQIEFVFPPNETFKMLMSSDEVLSYLVDKGYINKNKFKGEYVLPRTEQQSSLLENKYANEDKPETIYSLSKITDINNFYNNKYNLGENIIIVEPFGKTYKIRINNHAVVAINKQRANPGMLSPIDISIDDWDIQGHALEWGDADNYEPNEFSAKGLIALKKKLIKHYNHEIKVVSKQRDSSTRASTIASLNTTISNIKSQLYGDPANDKTGIIQDVKLLENIKNPLNLESYAKKDLDRMIYLATKSNRLADLQEALTIGNFYMQVSNTSNDSNPLFTAEEIKDMYLVPNDPTLLMIQEWGKVATRYVGELNNRAKKTVVNMINNSKAVQDITNGEGFTEDQIFNTDGMKDIGIMTRWLLNPASANNGLNPQLQMHLLRIATERHLALSKKQGEVIEKLMPEVEKTLAQLGHSLKNLGIKGVSYDPFFQLAEDGKSKTGKLIGRYSVFYEMAYIKAKEDFDNAIKIAYHDSDPKTSKEKQKAARSNFRDWIKDNNTILDFTNVAEIRDFISNDDILSSVMSIDDTKSLVTAQSLDITEKHFEEIVEEQISLLKRYKENRIAQLANILEEEGKSPNNNYASLTDSGKRKFNYWDYQNSPIYGRESITDSHVTNVYSDFEFNVLIPKKISTVNQPTNYYDEKFNVIEENKSLYEFRQAADKLFTYMSNSLPEGTFDKFINNSLPMHHKGLVETFFDNNDGSGLARRVSKASNLLMDNISLSLGIHEPGQDPSSSSLTEREGLYDYNVNSRFLTESKSEIKRVFDIEKVKFEIELRKAGYKVGEIRYNTEIHEININDTIIRMLANTLNCDSNLESIRRVMKLNPYQREIPIGRILHIYATNAIYETKSYNLAKTLLLYSALTAEYNARAEVLPIINYLNQEFEKIPNSKEGKDKRDNAIASQQSWYYNKALGYYSTTDMGVVDDESWKRYSSKEKEQLDEINKLLSNPDINKEEKERLLDIKDSIGRKFAWSRVLQGVLNFIRVKGLGWSVLGAITNRVDAMITLTMAAASGEFFSNESYHRVAYISRNKQDKKKIKLLMERYKVLQDATNEFQQAELKTSFARFKSLQAYQMSRAIEYLNQSPVMLAYLLDNKIKGVDENGKVIESNVWDALDANGKLKKGFDSDENKNNWENANGEEYYTLKSKISAFIKRHYGDYDPLSGFEARTNVVGRAATMFRGYLPETFNRFWGPEKLNLELGIVQKGVMRSTTPISGMIKGMTTFGVTGGIPGMVVGAIGGIALGFMYNTKNSVNTLEELTLHSKILVKKFFGIPINTVAAKFSGKQVIKMNDIEEYMQAGFTERDARNLAQLMTATILELQLIMLGLIVKLMLWDPDDDKDDARRMAYFLLINRINSTASGLTQLTNPLTLVNELATRGPALSFINDLWGLPGDISGVMLGTDTYIGGIHSGESKIKTRLSRIILPTVARDPLSLGFESQMIKDYSNNALPGGALIEYLKKDKDEREKDSRIAARATYARKYREENPDASEKEVRRAVNKFLPLK